jgi:hypothetical protein
MSLPTPTDGWVVEPREAPPELAEHFPRKDFNGIEAGRDWVTLAEKIGQAKRDELMAIFGGYPIDPSA